MRKLAGVSILAAAVCAGVCHAEQPLIGPQPRAKMEFPQPAASNIERAEHDPAAAPWSDHDMEARESMLPDAPTPNLFGTDLSNLNSTDQPVPVSSSAAPASTSLDREMVKPLTASEAENRVELKDCPYDRTGAHECRPHWKQLAISSAVFLTFQNTANLYDGYWLRYQTFHGKWWHRYINSVDQWRWNRWKDDNPFLDDYVGHPIMGGITDALWIQNDPKGMTLEQSNSWAYWRSRLRAATFSTFYSFEWKMGPIGEASIGHNGDFYYVDPQGKYTNGTGVVELVTTPLGGLAWTLAEDRLDKAVIRRLENKSRNPILLTVYQLLNPARGTANFLRFRPPWYRDSRVVKASSFWSDPEEEPAATTLANERLSVVKPAAAAVISTVARVERPDFTRPGGVHELGLLWGLSLMSGHLFGSSGDVKYMPMDVRYSYLLRMRDTWALRYSPEITALTLIDWPTQQNPSALQKRTRSYGSGLSPIGFQADLFPTHRFQPFVSTGVGFIHFYKPVLATQGPQWMSTSDVGAGINFFHKRRQAVTLGYRYQHLAPMSFNRGNPSTDANTFYVGVSRFRTRATQ